MAAKETIPPSCVFLIQNDYLNEFQLAYSLLDPLYDLSDLAREYPPKTFLERYGIEITSNASGPEQELISSLDALVFQTRNLLQERRVDKKALIEALKEVGFVELFPGLNRINLRHF